MITLREKSCRQPAARRKQSYIEQEVKKVNRKIKKTSYQSGRQLHISFFLAAWGRGSCFTGVYEGY